MQKNEIAWELMSKKFRLKIFVVPKPDLVGGWMDGWLGVKPGLRDCLGQYKKRSGTAVINLLNEVF
jgi:hypothetical protein